MIGNFVDIWKTGKTGKLVSDLNGRFFCFEFPFWARKNFKLY